MGNISGTEFNIMDSKAKELIARGSAISLEPVPDKEPLFEKKKEIVVEKEVEIKEVMAPEVDKMFRRKFSK